MGEAQRLRHRLHRHPETANEEADTAETIASFLADHDVEVRRDVAGHGLVAHLPGKRDGRHILLRADMDALPLDERSGVAHASQRDGRHHACGHDGHMAMLACALAQMARRDDLGPVTAIFQPAEETGEGAARMVEEGLPRADLAFAIHNVPGRRLGEVGVRNGSAAVASTGLRVAYQGSTAHAARPHEGRNPLPALATLVHESARAPSACLPMDHCALVTPVGLRGGDERYGTAAGDGMLALTLRATTTQDLQSMVDHMRRHARSLGDAYGLRCSIHEVEPFPASVNDDAAVALVQRAAREAGLDVHEPDAPQPWSEDFGHVLDAMPGALILLGAGEDAPALHTPEYDFPDDLLEPGIRFWCALAEAAAAEVAA